MHPGDRLLKSTALLNPYYSIKQSFLVYRTNSLLHVTYQQQQACIVNCVYVVGQQLNFNIIHYIAGISLCDITKLITARYSLCFMLLGKTVLTEYYLLKIYLKIVLSQQWLIMSFLHSYKNSQKNDIIIDNIQQVPYCNCVLLFILLYYSVYMCVLQCMGIIEQLITQLVYTVQRKTLTVEKSDEI